MQAGPALAEQGADAVLVAQVAQRRGEVDEALVADDLAAEVAVSGGSASEAVKTSTAAAFA